MRFPERNNGGTRWRNTTAGRNHRGTYVSELPPVIAATTASATDSALIGFGRFRSYGWPRACAELGRDDARVHD